MYKTRLEVVNGQISRFTKPCPNKSGRRDPIPKDLLEVVNNRWEFIKSQYCGLQSRPPGAVKAKSSPAHPHLHPSYYTLYSSRIQIGCVQYNPFRSNSVQNRKSSLLQEWIRGNPSARNSRGQHYRDLCWQRFLSVER